MQVKLSGPCDSEYLTTGKVYDATQLDGILYTIVDDDGEKIFILFNGFCAHALPARWIEA